jgi:hypothetical protein
MAESKVHVTFRLVGEDFDTDEITRQLDILPTKSRKKNQSPKVLIENGNAFAYWIFRTEDVESSFVSEEFKKLRDLLSDKKEIILQLCEKYSLETQIDVVISASLESIPEIFLEKEDIEFASFLETGIGFDLSID